MEKPLVSLCIYTYKQENFVRETLEAAVAQDYPNLEIIVSDDCSPDNTFGVIQDFANNYKGSHKLIINRNESNLGIAGNVMKLFSLSNGKYIVNNCGDDLSVPTRVSQSVELIQQEKVHSASFGMTPLQNKVANTGFFEKERDEEVRYTMDDYINNHYKSSGASRIMSRDIVEVFGPLNQECPTEDSPFTLRAFLLGDVVYSFRHLVQYRIHGENTSIGSNYLKRIKPEPIYRQYVKDVETALSKKLISANVYSSLMDKFHDYLDFEVNCRKIYFKRGFLLRSIELIRVLLLGSISYKNKKKLIHSFLSWIKNGF